MGGALSLAFDPIIVSAHDRIPRVFEEPQWYAVQTRYRCERKVAEQFLHKDVEAFLPLYEEVHRWSDRQKTVQVPLFSGYVFVHLPPHPGLRLRVLHTNGVMGFVTFNGTAVSIPSKQIEDLRTLLANGVSCALQAFLRTGQRVRVRGGCLDGVEGVLMERGEKFLVISIASIERSVAIKIEGYNLELI
jgi:transcriptional antiterminator NusG